MKKIKVLLQHLRPLPVGAVLCLIGILISLLDLSNSGGWSMMGVIYLLPLMLILAATDSILIFFFKKNRSFLLLLESVFLVAILLLYFYFVR